jgi:diphthamide biosynthesis protein 4
MSTARTHYEVLHIQDDAELTSESVKQAYHRALLLYHPDKLQQSNTTTAAPKTAPRPAGNPTIDQIVAAYAVLSDPEQRKSYNAALKTSHGHNVSHQGIDTFDLDDMQYSEVNGRAFWQRGCRCDSKEGYIVTEYDLEKADKEQTAQQDGFQELLVQCRGCSLIVRITFAVTGE